MANGVDAMRQEIAAAKSEVKDDLRHENAARDSALQSFVDGALEAIRRMQTENMAALDKRESENKVALKRHESENKVALERYESETRAALEKHESETRAALEKHESENKASMEKLEFANRASMEKLEFANKATLESLRSDMMKMLAVWAAGIAGILLIFEFVFKQEEQPAPMIIQMPVPVVASQAPAAIERPGVISPDALAAAAEEP